MRLGNDMERLSKMKIMHVLKSSIYSGAENVAISIMRGLAEEFDFIYVATDGVIRERLEHESVTFVLVPSFDRKNLRNIIAEQRPDIIHAHDFSATVLCASLKGQFRLISQLHYNPPWVMKWNMRTLVYALCKNRIERVLAVSSNIIGSMIFADDFAGKWTVVGNPIDVLHIRQMAKQAVLENENKDCDFIFVGRLVEQKNPQRFIKLISDLKQSGWNSVQAWILGTGELLSECEELIDCLNLHENINIKGFQKNPYGYIEHARVLCMTSRWEGYGLVALEANILGTPVLSTRNAGCTEILGNESEALCDTDNQFVMKMKYLSENQEIYALWKQQALERASRFDNKEEYMSVLSCIYRNEVSD